MAKRPSGRLCANEERAVDELIRQITERTGIGEDKARLAAQIVIAFLKTKSPGIGSQLDGLAPGEGISQPAAGAKNRVRETIGGIFGNKTA